MRVCQGCGFGWPSVIEYVQRSHMNHLLFLEFRERIRMIYRLQGPA